MKFLKKSKRWMKAHWQNKSFRIFLAVNILLVVLLSVENMLLFSAGEHLGSEAEWYLIAIQNYAKDFIGELNEEEKTQLASEYRKKYPSGRRLPLQNEIYSLLSGGKKEPFWKWHISWKNRVNIRWQKPSTEKLRRSRYRMKS